MTDFTTIAHRLYIDQRGEGPDVLLLAGLGDVAEAWEAQLTGLADRYRLVAFDNPGAGRSPLPPEGITVASMADAAASVLAAVDVESAHVCGFSGGGAIAQELALRHPDAVRSLVLVGTFSRLDAFARRATAFWEWLFQAAPSEREALEWFYLWIYTGRAHDNGLADAFIDEALSFAYQQPPESILAQLQAFTAWESYDRLPAIDVPTLVITGGQDMVCPPRLGRVIADRVPGATFEVWPDEAHQPFQEVPEQFNARVDAFWREVDGRS